MPKYAIIDLEKLAKRFPNYMNDRTVKEGLKSGIILSPEETEEVFKGVFEAGCDHVFENFHRDGYEGDQNKAFEEFKKTL